VMSIATVHRSLYETSTEGRVRADELMRGTIGKLISASVANETDLQSAQDYDPIVLYPDQAVPLSLLASEATTNALKYIGRPEGRPPQIEVSLKTLAPGTGRLSVVNTKGRPLLPPEQVSGTGLGTNLIKAFAQQLGGRLVVEDGDDFYSVVVEFPIASFDESQTDGSIAEID